MRRKYAVFALMALVALGACSPSTEAGPSLQWKNYVEGMKAGREQGKDILIHFYANWCRYCEKMEKETYRNKEVASYLKEHFVLIKVDVDRQRGLSVNYGVRGLPTVWFLKETGERITALPGYVPPGKFLPIVKFIQTKAYEKMSFEEFMKES